MKSRLWEKLFGVVLMLVSATLMYLYFVSGALRGWAGILTIGAIMTPLMLVAFWWVRKNTR